MVQKNPRVQGTTFPTLTHLQFCKVVDDLLRMPRGVDLAIGLGHVALWVDEKGVALGEFDHAEIG